tara:strand:+ start:4790 stop:5593 length:804 start_codon:yes stop_codon:yes gene_type:complete
MRTKYGGVAKGAHVAMNRGKSEFVAPSSGKLHGGKSPRTDVIAKKRRDKALEEIRKYQRSAENVIPFGPFQRLVKEHVKASRPKLNLRVARQAVLALQSATEAFVVEVFQKVNLNAIHAKRITATVADVLHLIDSDKITNGALAGMNSTRPVDTTRTQATRSATGEEEEEEAEGTSAKGSVGERGDLDTNEDDDEDVDEDDDENDGEDGNCADQATGMIEGLLHSNADVATTEDEDEDDEEEGDDDVPTTEDEDVGNEGNSGTDEYE